MKGSLRCLLVFITIILLVSLLGSCSLLYSVTEVENITMGYSNRLKKAFIGSVSIPVDESVELILPDEYEGLKVTDLGGYFGRGVPTPFCICFDINQDEKYDECFFAFGWDFDGEETDLCDEYEVHEVIVSVSLPKYLETVKYVSQGVQVGIVNREDGTKFADVYKVIFYFTIDPANPNFYTSDGKLYKKQNDELAEGFCYE